MENQVRKVKGQTFAKIVWIIGALYMGFMTIGTFISIFQDGISANTVFYFIQSALEFVAFIIGLVYLFNVTKEKLAVVSACLCAVSSLLSFIRQIIDGSKYAAIDMAYMIVSVVVMILFAIIVVSFVKGQDGGAYSIWVKIWWLPLLVQLVLALIESIITELNDTQGFDPSLVVLDVLVAVFSVLPLLTMMIVVKNGSAKA